MIVYPIFIEICSRVEKIDDKSTVEFDVCYPDKIGDFPFVKVYYAISPTLVKWFGNTDAFKSLCKRPLDKLVKSLQSKGCRGYALYG